MNSVLNIRNRLNLCANFVIVVGITLLGGCSSVASISTPTGEGTTETAIPPTTTALPVPEKIVKFQPFNVISEVSLNTKPLGALVVCDVTTIKLLRFHPDAKEETILASADDIFCLATSPDGKWIAYEQDSDESPTGHWLIVLSADGQRQNKVPKDPDWISFGDYVWLDNQHLIFNNFINPPAAQRLQTNPAYSIVIVNPFTGEHIELSSDYPGLGLGVRGPVGTMAFNYSDVVYDPSLNLVIFPAWEGDAYIILWDRQRNSVVAKVGGHAGYYPLWSPDAKKFVVPLLHPNENEHILEELFYIERAGQVEQLTHFGSYFIESRFGSGYNWSPDGQMLAFWLDVSPSLCPGLNLAVLDLGTKQVTDTCIPGLLDYALPPVWSLDSRHLVVINARTDPRQFILIDVKEHRAFNIRDITGGSRPIGWLVSP